MSQMFSDSVVEDAALEWFEGLGYSSAHGPEIAPDATGLERSTYTDVLLVDRLRNALFTLSQSDMDESRSLVEARHALLPILPSGEMRDR